MYVVSVLGILKDFFFFNILASVLKWNLLTAIRTWHPDSPPLEEASTRSWWPLTSHQGKEILTMKCFQSCGAGAWSLLRSYQKDLHPSAYQDSYLASNLHLDSVPLLALSGKVIHYVIRQVQPGPSLTSVLSGAEISASDVRDPEEPRCWDLIWKVFSLISWLRNWSQVQNNVHPRYFAHNSLFQVWSNAIFDFLNLI